MKKKLSLLLAFVLCLGLMPCAYADNNPFNDVAPGFWAYDAQRVSPANRLCFSAAS